MKAYIIKNKEGKYLSKYDNYDYSRVDYYKKACWTNNLLNAKIFKEEPFVNTSELVEITIAEGNLEHKIAVLERALKNTCWLLYGTYDEHYPNYFIQKAKKELKGEKDE